MANWLKRTAAAAMAGLVLAAAPAGTARAESLADALVLAYKHSNLLEQNRALLRAADEGVAEAVAATRPAINFAIQSQLALQDSSGTATTPASFTQTLSTTASLTYDITLYDFGRNRLAIEAAKETVLATRDSLTAVEQQVLLTAVNAYMDVLSAIEVVALRQSSVRLTTQELRAARDRFEVGEITRTDVAFAEARLAEARGALAQAIGQLEIARENYKAAVGRYPGRLMAPPRPPMTARSEDAAKAIAARTHPNILQAQHEVTVAELNIARAEAAMKPRVTGQIGLSANGRDVFNVPNGDSASVTGTAGVQLSAPIYQGGALSAALRRAMAQRDATRAALLQTTLQIKFGVGQAWAQLAVAQAQIEAAVQQVRAAQVAYDGVREEARLGARTTLDVLDAEQDLLDARVARISAETQQYKAIYALLSAMGLLTVEHLDLGIVTYDPEAYYNAVKDAPTRHVSPQGERLDSVLRRLGKE